jgi:heptosyltransferase-2
MKILIVKLGAMGDVLRTTCLLRVLEGEIDWITSKRGSLLLKNNPFIKNIILFDERHNIINKEYDLIISLEDEEQVLKFVSSLNHKKLVGSYYDRGATYSEDSSEWFDMGLISKYGKEKADELKKLNKRSYQEMLFSMLGKKFNGEEYVFDYPRNKVGENIIGVEKNAGGVWNLKKWPKYDELISRLKREGYKVKVFEFRKNITDYFNDINSCKVVVTGDTLTMHLGLVLEKKVVALFGPTSYNEIYGYGRMKKIYANMGCLCCYRRTCDKKPNCMDNISVEEVYKTVRSFT